jgi:hypothetical protein
MAGLQARCRGAAARWARKDISPNLRRTPNLGTNPSAAPTFVVSLRVVKGQKRGRKSIREGRAPAPRRSRQGSQSVKSVSSVTERVLNAGRLGWSRFHIVTERNLGVLAAKAPP